MSNSATADAVEVFAPAKLNWYLKILRRRPDGFHDLDTVFQTLELGDTLRIRRTGAPGCRIALELAPDLRDEFSRAIPTGPDNLIHRAWHLMAVAYPAQATGIEAAVDKQLPGGAGLGGGSADAAAVIVALDRLWGLGLPIRELERHAAALGSDCAFFIRGGAARGLGRGEQLTPVASALTGLAVLLVWPGFPSSTAEAYGALRPEDLTGESNAPEVMRALEHNDPKKLMRSLENTFNPVVLGQDFRYNHLIKRLKTCGAGPVELCGSGSTLFVTGSDLSGLEALAGELRKTQPWVRVAGLRTEGVAILKA